jgi:hypothetical protein
LSGTPAPRAGSHLVAAGATAGGPHSCKEGGGGAPPPPFSLLLPLELSSEVVMAAASMAPAARSSVTSPDPPALLPDLRPVPPDLLPRDLDVSGGRQRRRRGSAWARFASAATRPRRVRLPCISVGASGSGSGGGFRRDRCGARVLPFVAMAAGGVLRRGGFHGRRAAWWTVSWVWRCVLTDKTRIHLRSASVQTYTFFTTGFPRFLSIRGARGLLAVNQVLI